MFLIIHFLTFCSSSSLSNCRAVPPQRSSYQYSKKSSKPHIFSLNKSICTNLQLPPTATELSSPLSPHFSFPNNNTCYCTSSSSRCYHVSCYLHFCRYAHLHICSNCLLSEQHHFLLHKLKPLSL